MATTSGPLVRVNKIGRSRTLDAGALRRVWFKPASIDALPSHEESRTVTEVVVGKAKRLYASAAPRRAAPRRARILPTNEARCLKQSSPRYPSSIVTIISGIGGVVTPSRKP
jgi:hypothetical protein